MRYIKYTFNNGYAGDSETMVCAFTDNVTDKDIDEMLYADLQDWAEHQVNGVEGWSFDEGWESEEDEEWYYENLEFYWEEITEEEFKEWED